MESLEHNCGKISPTICTNNGNMLVFSKDTFLVLISRMISTNPISFGEVTLYHSIIATFSPYEPQAMVFHTVIF